VRSTAGAEPVSGHWTRTLQFFSTQENDSPLVIRGMKLVLLAAFLLVGCNSIELQGEGPVPDDLKCNGNSYSLRCWEEGLPHKYGISNTCTFAYLTGPNHEYLPRAGDLSDCHDLSGSDIWCCP